MTIAQACHRPTRKHARDWPARWIAQRRRSRSRLHGSREHAARNADGPRSN